MSKFHRWKKRPPDQGEGAARVGDEDEPVELDVERLQKSLNSPMFLMPSGLTPEQKRQFILAVAARHR